MVVITNLQNAAPGFVVGQFTATGNPAAKEIHVKKVDLPSGKLEVLSRIVVNSASSPTGWILLTAPGVQSGVPLLLSLSLTDAAGNDLEVSSVVAITPL